MPRNAQKKALDRYRERLRARGMVRFEVLGLGADRDLVRALARRLADNDAEAAQIRTAVRKAMAVKPSETGGILRALRRSPLVGADLDLARVREPAREIDL